MSKNILKSKFALVAVLGSAVALSACTREIEKDSDKTQVCKFEDRHAFLSEKDPSFIELRVSTFTVLHGYVDFSSRGIYTEDEVKEIAMNYCFNNEYPQFP